MKNINECTLLGNLGQDAALNYTSNNRAVVHFSLATNIFIPNGKDDQGKIKYKPETDWHTVIVWGPLAENVHKFAKKGDTVEVKGRIHTYYYEKDGIQTKRTEIKAGKVTLKAKKKS